MLTGTLLKDDDREALRGAVTIPVGILSKASLDPITSGFRAYSSMRTRRRLAANASGTISAESDLSACADLCASVAKSFGELPTNTATQLISRIPSVLQGSAPGAVALRTYWSDLGFAAADVDNLIAEGVKAGGGLSGIGKAIQELIAQPEALKQFGTGNPDPSHWWLGFSGDGQIHPATNAFVVACRQAGVTPSLYVIASFALLMHKLAEEVRPGK